MSSHFDCVNDYTSDINKSTDLTDHSNTCFFEHQIKDWLLEKLSFAPYDKLQKRTEIENSSMRITEGRYFLNGVPVSRIVINMRFSLLLGVFS